MRPNTVSAALAATLVAVAVTGCGGSDKAGGESKPDATVLTLANGNDDSHNLEPFAAAVERLSGGSLRIQFKNSWREGEPGFEEGVIHDVADGRAALGWAGSRAFDDVGVQSFDALHAPLLIDNYPLQRKVLENPLATQMLEGLEPVGLVGIGILPGPMRKPLGVEALVRPADYHGATIAYQRSEVAERTLRALGARPSEIPSAGDIRPYDGVEQQIGAIAGNEYDKLATRLAANVNLWPRPVVLFAGREAWDGLDESQRKALHDAARAALPVASAQEQVDDEEGAAILCHRGAKFLTAGDADLVALRRTVQPVYAWLERDAQTKAAIGQILAMRSRSPSPPDAPVCSAPEPEPAVSKAVTPVDGVYRSDITLEQLSITPGYDSGENNPSNVGHFRMELHDGRFRITGSSDGVDQEGNFSLDGGVLTFHNWNGEADFSYKWNLYRGVLTMRKTGEGPTIFAVHPWRSTGGATSAGDAP